MDNMKTFAQQFRSSPYFLRILTLDYEPEAVLTSGEGPTSKKGNRR